MKIAVVTDDGETISKHFGRAAHYMVATIENGQVVRRELKDKSGHNQFSHDHHGDHHHVHRHGEGHGMDADSHRKHMQMAEPIADCEVVLCRGMGQGAFQSMQANGILPLLTDIEEIEDAVQAYLKGEIQNRIDFLH